MWSMRSSTPGRRGSRNIRDGRDALLEQRLAGPVERRARRACGPPRRGPTPCRSSPCRARPLPSSCRSPGRLVRAGEPGADHDLRRTGGEGEGDVARVAHAPVGPDVLAQPAASAAHSSTAENCGRPTAVIMRVVHMAPGPTPTLTMSAPAAIRSRVPSAVTTLPATTGTCGSSERTAPSASSILRWWPCAVSTTSTSTPASSSSAALAA